MAGWLTNGMGGVYSRDTTNNSYRRPTGAEQIPVDTDTTSGVAPQTVALTAFEIAALAASLVNNTGTLSSDAATQNTLTGNITTEAKTTAVGASFTGTITNSTVSASSVIDAVVSSRTNTVPGAYVSAITPASGSFTVAITNGGTAALNGTLQIAYRVNG